MCHFSYNYILFRDLSKIRNAWTIVLLYLIQKIYIFLATCSTKKCPLYGNCVMDSVNNAECVCPVCQDDYDLVCSTSGVTYASTCRLKREACLKEIDQKVLKDSACGNIVYFIIIFYA